MPETWMLIFGLQCTVLSTRYLPFQRNRWRLKDNQERVQQDITVHDSTEPWIVKNVETSEEKDRFALTTILTDTTGLQ